MDWTQLQCNCQVEEAVPTSMSEVISGILGEMDQVVKTPHIFWGHSFGGIVAFEVLKALRRQENLSHAW
jgi:surfactin synthase thioesterase subunit